MIAAGVGARVGSTVGVAVKASVGKIGGGVEVGIIRNVDVGAGCTRDDAPHEARRRAKRSVGVWE